MESMEMIAKDQRLRRWSFAEKAALMQSYPRTWHERVLRAYMTPESVTLSKKIVVFRFKINNLQLKWRSPAR